MMVRREKRSVLRNDEKSKRVGKKTWNDVDDKEIEEGSEGWRNREIYNMIVEKYVK